VTAAVLGFASAGNAGGVKLEKGSHWAQVDVNGNLVKGSKDVLAAVHEDTGAYHLQLKNSVQHCGYTVSVDGFANTGEGLPYWETGVGPEYIGNITTNSAGSLADRPFWVTIICTT